MDQPLGVTSLTQSSFSSAIFPEEVADSKKYLLPPMCDHPTIHNSIRDSIWISVDLSAKELEAEINTHSLFIDQFL